MQPFFVICISLQTNTIQDEKTTAITVFRAIAHGQPLR